MTSPLLLDKDGIGEVFEIFFPRGRPINLHHILIDSLDPESLLLKKEGFSMLSREAKDVWKLAKTHYHFSEMFKDNGRIRLGKFKSKAIEELGLTLGTVNRAIKELASLASRL